MKPLIAICLFALTCGQATAKNNGVTAEASGEADASPLTAPPSIADVIFGKPKPIEQPKKTTTVPEFYTLSDYAMTCECGHLDCNDRIGLEIRPSEWKVNLFDGSGKLTSMKIVEASMNVTNTFNRYGNQRIVPYVQYMKLEDKQGRRSLLNNEYGTGADYIGVRHSSGYMPFYRCILH